MTAKKRKPARAAAETPKPKPIPDTEAATHEAAVSDAESEREPDVFDEVIAARAATAAGPAESAPPTVPAAEEPAARAGEARAFQPDPFPVLSVALRDGADAPRVRLFRNRRMNQVAVGFDQKPAEPHRQRLRDEGYKWRDAEGVWTKQLGDERATGQLTAERLVAEIGDAIRAENGLAQAGRPEGRRAGGR